MSRPHTTLVEILEILRERGPLTFKQICTALERGRDKNLYTYVSLGYLLKAGECVDDNGYKVTRYKACEGTPVPRAPKKRQPKPKRVPRISAPIRKAVFEAPEASSASVIEAAMGNRSLLEIAWADFAAPQYGDDTASSVGAPAHTEP